MNRYKRICQVFFEKSLTSRMLILGLPVLVAVLFLIFAASGSGIKYVLNRAIARNIQLQAQAMSLAMEQALEVTRNQLLILAAGSMDVREMADRLRFRAKAGGLRYRELAYEGVHPESRYLLLSVNDEVVEVPLQQALASPTGPFHAPVEQLRAGQVSISSPLEAAYSMVPVQGRLQNITLYILRFTTHVEDINGNFNGYLMLSLDLRDLRDILSEYSAPDTPLQIDNDLSVRSLFFDREGWLLFQSEPVNDQLHQLKLRTDTARAGLTGVFGRPGFNTAFRPGPEHIEYWDMVVSVQSGHSGQLAYTQRGWGDAPPVKHCSYVPLRFIPGSGEHPIILGGVAVLDSGFSTTRSGVLLFAISATAFVGGTLLLGASLWWLSGQIGKSLQSIASEVDARNAAHAFHPLDLPPLPRELEHLKEGINLLLDRMHRTTEHQKRREAEENALQKREVLLDLPQIRDMPPDGIVGFSPAMRALLDSVYKAARVEDDVLIVGETGTGKELIAEAIHMRSARASGSFITINCGALDENLLMDTLFGHVKGAFTEARTARKGAFLAAEGGTLMLDEVGNAAPKVQQALLRALSTRRIRPLGSDHDMPFDTRIIAATNAPLLEDAQRGSFREDLYYRLAVITIQTPPLRQRKEDIPALTVFFLDAASRSRIPLHEGGCEHTALSVPPQISRGALEKLMAYNWPGNVRELKNTLTRAVTFCEGSVLYAEDIQLSDGLSIRKEKNAGVVPSTHFLADGGAVRSEPSASSLHSVPSEDVQVAPSAIGWASLHSSHDSGTAVLPCTMTSDNAASSSRHYPLRLEKAWQDIFARDVITRQEYQEMTGGSISIRTAQHDLQLLVAQGLLRKVGHGPALRYVVVHDPHGPQTIDRTMAET